MLVIAVSLVRARVLVVVIVQVVHDDVHRDRRAEEREDEEGEETKGRARHYELVGASRETRKYIPMNDKRARRFDTPPVLLAKRFRPLQTKQRISSRAYVERGSSLVALRRRFGFDTMMS